jgi:hypothetical protein
MPEVSVLVPAFRPDFLDLTIASVLAQTFQDFEIIVSDDSEGVQVESVVRRWEDARLTYVRNPRPRAPGANRDYLISCATGKYLKFVFDDDFLLPRSLEVLRAVATALGAKLVFHGRYVVGPRGVPSEPAVALRPGQVAEIPPSAVFDCMIGAMVNFIGEPSNILVEAEALRSMDKPFAMRGERMRFLTDVALYMNFALSGHKLAGVGAALSAFRRHSQQTSSRGSPIFGAGLFEWEYLARVAADCGALSPERCRSSILALHEQYRQLAEPYPELAVLLELPGEPGPGGKFLAARELEAFAKAWSIVDSRATSELLGAPVPA